LTEWYVTTTGRPWPGREAIAFARLSAGLSPATTDNAVARFDGTSGALQNSGVTIDDADLMTINPSSALVDATAWAQAVGLRVQAALPEDGTAVGGSAICRFQTWCSDP
jgi:hypothetical protein